MKNHNPIRIITALCALALGLLGAGCASMTPQQAVATGIYASGYAAASDNLDHDAALVPVIQDVAGKLPQINSGKLTSTEMGVLTAELEKLAANNALLAKLVPAESDKLTRANAFLAGVIQSNAALNGGRAPTADQVMATTALTDFSNGLLDGIGYWQGRQSVKHPMVPPIATP